MITINFELGFWQLGGLLFLLSSVPMCALAACIIAQDVTSNR